MLKHTYLAQGLPQPSRWFLQDDASNVQSQINTRALPLSVVLSLERGEIPQPLPQNTFFFILYGYFSFKYFHTVTWT